MSFLPPPPLSFSCWSLLAFLEPCDRATLRGIAHNRIACPGGSSQSRVPTLPVCPPLPSLCWGCACKFARSVGVRTVANEVEDENHVLMRCTAYDQLRLGSEIDFTGGMQAVMQNADPARLAALLDSIWEHRSISTPIRGPN